MKSTESITPMVKQYQDIKSRHEDAILFFRLGDFYEMFNDDAKTASRELELTLTGRGEGEKRMPMCGIPYHAADNYISKLLGKGYKVAICEQVEDPRTAKGVVKREVIKVITPGTIQEERMLDKKSGNYLLSLSFIKGATGIAYVDASTGEFRATVVKGKNAVEEVTEEINRVSPSEILFPDIVPEDFMELKNRLKASGNAVTDYKDIYDVDTAQKKLKEHFRIGSLESLGLSDFRESFGAAAAILDYLQHTQKGSLGHINSIQAYETGKFMRLDCSTRRNLELISTVREGSSRGSLLWVLDRTVTAMGSRVMKRWLLQPLLDMKEINLRLDAVQELSESFMIRKDLADALRDVSDIERLVGRVASGSANARDLVALKESLKCLPRIKNVINSLKSLKLKRVIGLDERKEVADIIEKAINNDPPNTLKEGGLIRSGYDVELDKLKGMVQGNKEWISQLENKERQRTGIKSLKVGYTSVFGYYIEVSKSNLALVPADYTRKQTLVNCERFVTQELKEREALILNAEEKLNEMEYEIFSRVRAIIAGHTEGLQEIACALAETDALLSFAEVGAQYKYARPVFDEKNGISIKAGRHPVVELTLGDNSFIPNDTEMDPDEARFVLITGPNMAGKSTYMRQIALICLMAQVGSFVPGKSAKLPVIDRIFTRIGAMDDIFAGQSTFMVEMTETANIINNATSKSLIILDEIGRGTSTFDGMSIAASVAEYIHDNIKAYTLFATHYHEITQLAEKHPGMINCNTLVEKEGDRVIFLHKIVNGAADQSYGIEVAKLAGLPDEVISRAKDIYKTLEMVENGVAGAKKNKRSSAKDQMGLF